MNVAPNARVSFVVMAVVIMISVAPMSRATIHNIDVGNFFFSPTGTVVQPGDTVRWTRVSGTHTTTSEVGSPKSWDSGIMGAMPFDVVLSVLGTCFMSAWIFIGGMMFRDSLDQTRRVHLDTPRNGPPHRAR